MLRVPARGRSVTAEPLTVDPRLLGAPLASFRRRLAAYALDLALFALVVVGAFVVLALAGIHREDPTLLPRLGTVLEGDWAAAAADSTLGDDLLALVARRAPGALPLEVERAALAGDRVGLDEHWGRRDLVIRLTSGRTRVGRDGDRSLLHVGSDVWLGRGAGFFSWGACFVGWFTLWARATGGRSPGKWLCGVRVVRLDGRRIGWWTAFGRAGGYSASAATLLLGFLEMIWDPNRQALHDRIAATVVLRSRRRPPAPPAEAP